MEEKLTREQAEKYLKIFRMDTTIDGDNKLNITLINL